MHTLGVCGVITNAANEVLLIRTAIAGWELPGGRVESGEDLHTALRREVLEETGHVLTEIGCITGVYSHTGSDTVLVVFRAAADAASVTEPDDADALERAWLEPARALKLVTHPSEHDRLKDALRAEPTVVYRAY